MAPVTLSFLGGNGHSAARLAQARAFLAKDVDLIEAPYPGFEGRPRVTGLESFLDVVGAHLDAVRPDLVYAAGIGGLLALCLRSRGALPATPILMQAPVLWGLEQRWMPRLMRLHPFQGMVSRVFATSSFQRRFVRRHFTRAPDAGTAEAFFEGYARCAALPDFFAWLRPALLRSLERKLTDHPEALESIRVWWGGKDAVVTPRELTWTAAALPAVEQWPVRIFPEWGHYPMIDAPAEWAQAVAEEVKDAVATA